MALTARYSPHVMTWRPRWLSARKVEGLSDQWQRVNTGSAG